MRLDADVVQEHCRQQRGWWAQVQVQEQAQEQEQVQVQQQDQWEALEMQQRP